MKKIFSISTYLIGLIKPPLIPLCFLFIVSASADAELGMQKLNNFFKEVKTMRAEFHQTVKDANNKMLQEASGQLVMVRPGKFRWDYQQPFEQVIVADGKKLWIYDKDLAQITVKPLDTALGGTPALLLTGKIKLERDFIIKELSAQGDKRTWIQLFPKNKESNFENIRIAFGSKFLEVMELVDGFGQTTRLSFYNLQYNSRINAALFDFSPPAGVDVIGEE